ncbi:MAG: adenosylcobinamide amidohydrolase [Pelotomaculum sp.]|nr:adenosylcobinamide amidohydrolase [Pelotomaculum sp.]
MFEELTAFNMNVPIKGISFYLVENKTFLIASRQLLKVLSSAVLGGERRRARFIMNHTVEETYSSESPAEDLARLAERMNLGKDVLGLMTAVDVRRTVMSFGTRQDLAVATVCTAGVSNACSAGNLAVASECVTAPGTINTVVLIDGNLTEAAMVNAVITATEAKTRAVFQAGIRLPDGAMATGTTTDAIVIACTGRGKPLPYAGSATDLGYLVGRTVYRAVAQGISDYLAATGPDKLERPAGGVLLN